MEETTDMQLMSAELKKYNKNTYAISLCYKWKKDGRIVSIDIPTVLLPIELPLDKVKCEDINTNTQNPSISLPNGINLPIICDAKGIGVKLNEFRTSFIRNGFSEKSTGESEGSFAIRYVTSKILSLLKEYNFTLAEYSKLKERLDIETHCQKIFEEDK